MIVRAVLASRGYDAGFTILAAPMTELMAITRFCFVPLCLAALATGAHAQMSGGALAPDATARQYQGPLQRNFEAARTVPAQNAEQVERRCREIAAAYLNGALSGPQDQTGALQEYNQRKNFDQANGKWDDYRRNAEQMNALQGDYSAGNAAKVYRDAGCR